MNLFLQVNMKNFLGMILSASLFFSSVIAGAGDSGSPFQPYKEQLSHLENGRSIKRYMAELDTYLDLDAFHWDRVYWLRSNTSKRITTLLQAMAKRASNEPGLGDSFIELIEAIQSHVAQQNRFEQEVNYSVFKAFPSLSRLHFLEDRATELKSVPIGKLDLSPTEKARVEKKVKKQAAKIANQWTDGILDSYDLVGDMAFEVMALKMDDKIAAYQMNVAAELQDENGEYTAEAVYFFDRMMVRLMDPAAPNPVIEPEPKN